MVASSLEIIQFLVKKLKETLVVKVIENPSSFVSPSAYDTAWLAMIGDPNENYEKPMFKSCLEWILRNQMPKGFWGERDCHGNPTIDSLPATLACIIALKMWDIGHEHIEKGMAFLEGNSTKHLLKQKAKNENYPRWFAIVFPGMYDLAWQIGLRVILADDIKVVVAHIYRQQQNILKTEELVSKYNYPPLLSYLEGLPSSYQIDQATIINNLSVDGSLFQSPAATAAAYIATGNPATLSYLRNLVQACRHGVPSTYPIDEDCIKLLMVNQLQRLGLSDHFDDEIAVLSKDIYSKYYEEEKTSQHGLQQANIFKNSLAFEVLRLQEYKVSPRRFCVFLNDEYALQHIEENHEMFAIMLNNLYRATNLMFESEVELKELRSFSRRLLEKSCLSSNTTIDDKIIMWPCLQDLIKRELLVPWMARLDHLDHRKWIEANQESSLWLGKASFYRISCLNNMDLLRHAKDNYEYRQMVYKKELTELIRWSKVWGLMKLGFAREKTTYCYFAIASSAPFPYESDVRIIVAKSAVLITILDDFFDTKGSLDELRFLTKAVQSWDNKGLRSHSKILFDVLDNFVDEVATKYHDQHKIDITTSLRKLWFEAIDTWLIEATWSKTGHIPSMSSYMEIGMTSVAAHVMVLQASCFLTPNLNPHNLNPSQYEAITKLLMKSCRLLNDMQGYEREIKDGKINSVMLHLQENKDANMEEAVEYLENILQETKMKLLEYALITENDEVINHENLPKPCKMLHLTALKVFQMFYNSTNHFDSKDSLLNDINKAIFDPLENHAPLKPLKPLTLLDFQEKKRNLTINFHNINMSLKNCGTKKKLTIIRRTLLGVQLGSHQSRIKISPSCTFRFT